VAKTFRFVIYKEFTIFSMFDGMIILGLPDASADDLSLPVCADHCPLLGPSFYWLFIDLLFKVSVIP